MSSKIRDIATGTMWTTSSVVVISLVQILRLSILARFLAPEDFGVVAILLVVLGLTNTFADLGFSAAIMHKTDLNREEFSSLYWIQFSVYVIIYIIAIGLSRLVAFFYEEPALTTLLPIIMLDLLFWGVGKLYDTLLQKQYQFKTIAIRNIISALLSLILAILLAYNGAGVYSLILSTLFNTLILNLWNLFTGQKYIRLLLKYDIRSNVGLIRIGIYQTGTQILNYISNKFDILILGKVLGAGDLGIYNLAKEIVVKLYSLVNSIVTRVMLPYFAAMQNNKDIVQQYYCTMIKGLSVTNYFCYIIICILSTPLVCILYSSDYIQVAPLLSILCFSGMISCVRNPIGNIVVAFGRTDLSFKYDVIITILFIPCIYLFSKMGVTAMAWGQCILSFVSLQLTWVLILKPVITLDWSRWSKTYLPLLLISAIISALGFWLNNYFFVNPSRLSIYALCSTLCAIILYAVFVVLLYNKDLKKGFELMTAARRI